MNLLRHPWNLVFFAGFIVYISIRSVFIERSKSNEKRVSQMDALEKLLMAIVFVGSLVLPLVYLFTPLLAFADYHIPEITPIFGTAIMLCALWLFWKSHADLGLNWSMTLELRKGHQFVRNGIYRSIRHPMYASIWLFGIAQALLVPNWVAGFSALVTFAPLYFIRVPREEKMMLVEFGGVYRGYMLETGRVIPAFRREDHHRARGTETATKL